MADAGINDSQFVDIEVIQIEHWGKSNLPVEGLESRIAM